ncbi:sensor histidine kinase [Falsirhodobacter algicola]|uniref:histidine kinase n=1 Tax=Falsirhodobacter algicola TaxID=2692330 RepID=A0A8J8MTL0_9RHOB|nr:ATP-binding protein [Falsirhodobacter algicola]QUS36249.1 sensor histidine kinase [Falsirhodobacter algicola]
MVRTSYAGTRNCGAGLALPNPKRPVLGFGPSRQEDAVHTVLPRSVSSADDALWRICGHLAEETEIRSALDAVAAEIAELIPFSHVDVCLLESPNWVSSYEIGIKTRWSRTRTQVKCSPVRDILSGRTDTLLTDNAMEDPRYIYPGARCGPILEQTLRSRVSVVMKAMGVMIGSLNVSHTQAGLYDADSVETVRRLSVVLSPFFHALHSAERVHRAAHLSAEAIAREEGLRRGALGLTQAMESERQRIGMDLHDQTLADLTRILRDLSGEYPVPTAPVLAAKVGSCINDLRQIIDMAVPTLLQLFGFVHALRVHLERATSSQTIDTHIADRTGGHIDTLDPTTRTALYRIAQEAINNAVRHARAGEIRVFIEMDVQGNLILTIRDNGTGFDPGRDRLPSGLRHMQTRARLIAAQCDIFAQDGTCVTVCLPPTGEVRA